MKLTLPYKFTEEVVPFRCRKPRRVQNTAEITLTIHEVSKKDAPIAIIQTGKHFDGDKFATKKTVYRWWRNKLYVRDFIQRYAHAPLETQTMQQFAEDPYPYKKELPKNIWGSPYNVYQSKQERRNALMNWAGNILFIDGERWEVASEPRYVIMTFGLGHNHGLGYGTSLSESTSYNSNISRDRYFRIDELDKAIVAAEKTALGRGDTKDLPITKQGYDKFEILIPEAVRLKPHKEHGKGDEFMNNCEKIIQSSGDTTTAAFGLMANLASFL